MGNGDHRVGEVDDRRLIYASCFYHSLPPCARNVDSRRSHDNRFERALPGSPKGLQGRANRAPQPAHANLNGLKGSIKSPAKQAWLDDGTGAPGGRERMESNPIVDNNVLPEGIINNGGFKQWARRYS